MGHDRPNRGRGPQDLGRNGPPGGARLAAGVGAWTDCPAACPSSLPGQFPRTAQLRNGHPWFNQARLWGRSPSVPLPETAVVEAAGEALERGSLRGAEGTGAPTSGRGGGKEKAQWPAANHLGRTSACLPRSGQSCGLGRVWLLDLISKPLPIREPAVTMAMRELVEAECGGAKPTHEAGWPLHPGQAPF